MDNQEAQFILRSYRPCGSDAQDPAFREALKQAKLDPELAAWFADERQFDSCVCKKLRNISVPAELRAATLAGHKIIRRRITFRRRAGIGAMALLACLALVVMPMMLLKPQAVAAPVALKQICDKALSITANEEFDHLQKGSRFEKLRAWLKNNDTPAGFTLPASMEELASIGCKVLDVQGQKVSMICFWVDEAKGEAVHLFVVDNSAVKDPPENIRFEQQGGVVAAVWGDAEHAYILTTHGDEQSLRQLL